MIYTIDDFLNPDDLLKYKNYILNTNITQDIIKDETLTTEFWNTYGEKINLNLNTHFTGLYLNVTITNSKTPLIKHIDKKLYKESFKILIYLNTIPSGGTLFFIGEDKRLITNQANRLLIFDINLPHESQKFVGDKKMAIGFRLKD